MYALEYIQNVSPKLRKLTARRTDPVADRTRTINRLHQQLIAAG